MCWIVRMECPLQNEIYVCMYVLCMYYLCMYTHNQNLRRGGYEFERRWLIGL